MREILFRGKRPDGGWIFGSLLKVTFDGTTYNLIFADNFLFVFGQATSMEHADVIPETVGQFTGLTDCGKKKLFENDVVTAKFKSNGARYNFKIIFKDGAFLFDNGCVAVFFDQIRSPIKIGNIHDNPELIGGD